MTDEGTDQGAVQYFYNTSTKMVEKGRLSSWEHLLGPYGTREEAEKAAQIAAERNEAWDAADKAWNGDDD